MTRQRLIFAWGALIGLSLISTLLSFPQMAMGAQWALGAGVLVLAWLKARIILVWYLGLAAAPFWRRGFDISLGLFCALLLALYLVPLML